MAKSKSTKFDKRLETLAVKTRAQKESLLDQLTKYPIIHTACERAGVGRSTYYDWVKEDGEFAGKAEIALNQGAGFVNDMAESMLIKNIQGGNNTSIIFWLKNHHKGYNERVIHDHRFSIGSSENSDPIFDQEEIKAIMRAVNNCGYANVIKQNSMGLLDVDLDALERELPEAEKIIAPQIAQREMSDKEHRRRMDTEIHGLSEKEHEERERNIEKEKAEKKCRESIVLKGLFQKHHKRAFNLKEYEKNKVEEEKTGTKKKRGAFNLKKYLKKKAEKEKQG